MRSSPRGRAASATAAVLACLALPFDLWVLYGEHGHGSEVHVADALVAAGWLVLAAAMTALVWGSRGGLRSVLFWTALLLTAAAAALTWCSWGVL